MNDTTDPSRFRQDGRSTGREVGYRAELGEFFGAAAGSTVAVSYTHLTLPTICSV